MIERALICDVETTGLDPEKDTIIEVAAILYSIEDRSALVELSFIQGASGDIVSNEIEELTGITNGVMFQAYGHVPQSDCNVLIESLARQADVFVAHNAEFDREFLTRWEPDSFKGKPWLDTMTDFPWPKGAKAGKIAMLALDHGLAVCETHRALSDCRLISRLFTAMGDNLPAMFEKAMRPKSLYVATEYQGRAFFNLSKEDQERVNGMRRDAGFKWDRLVPRMWSRQMADEDADALPFRVAKFEDLMQPSRKAPSVPEGEMRRVRDDYSDPGDWEPDPPAEPYRRG